MTVIFITIWNTDSEPDFPVMVGMLRAQEGWAHAIGLRERNRGEPEARLDASGLPPTADTIQVGRHVRFVPEEEIRPSKI